MGMLSKHFFQNLGIGCSILVSISFYIPAKTKYNHPLVIKEKVVENFKPTYKNLQFIKAENLKASAGTKSVLFNSTGSKLYAMNLEGMSVYEFETATKTISRIFSFKPTKAQGWDYVTHKPMPSFEEKPVEACFSHNDEILWVSLHNAHGIVPFKLNALNKKPLESLAQKKVYIKNAGSTKKDSVYIPFIKTGKTPKVIARTGDSKFVLVSNWHSNNVSVLQANDSVVPYGKVIATIPVAAIPRGIVVDDANNKSYIAIMGGKTISVVDNATWKIERNLRVSSTPRHILMDNKSRLFVSYNSIGKIACIDSKTGATLFSASTNSQPRTIMFSKNQQYLFVTCYSGNTLDVFKINDNSFTKLYSLECKGKPVGVDIYEDDARLEAWVCNYVGGNLKVFTFNKN